MMNNLNFARIFTTSTVFLLLRKKVSNAIVRDGADVIQNSAWYQGG